MSGVAQVHVYPLGDGTWAVSVGGNERRLDTREEAMREARDLARSHAPSRLVQGPPAPGAAAGATVGAAAGATAGATAGAPNPAGPAAAAGTTPAPAAPAGAGTAAGSSWARLAGPPELGRSVVVGFGADVPEPWRGAERRTIRTADLGDPRLLEAVRLAYVTRTPMVYEIERRFEREGTAAPVVADVWRLPVDFELIAAATAELVSANSVDAFEPERPRWPLAERAVGAGASAGGRRDVVLPDGREAICDGGPLELWPAGSFGGAQVLPRIVLETGALAPLRDPPAAAALAPDQLAAVLARRAAARIIAPAGSGKTRVLTERARHLVRSGVPPASLCLVAFNQRAPGEMRDRTTDLARICRSRTLNALGLSILASARRLGREPSAADDRRDRTSADPAARTRQVPSPAGQHRPRLGLDRRAVGGPPRASRPRRGRERATTATSTGFAEVFARYRDRCWPRPASSTSTSRSTAPSRCSLADAGAPARRGASGRCRLLLVDEFQDLTPAHLLLIRLLAGPDAVGLRRRRRRPDDLRLRRRRRRTG